MWFNVRRCVCHAFLSSASGWWASWNCCISFKEALRDFWPDSNVKPSTNPLVLCTHKKQLSFQWHALHPNCWHHYGQHNGSQKTTLSIHTQNNHLSGSVSMTISASGGAQRTSLTGWLTTATHTIHERDSFLDTTDCIQGQKLIMYLYCKPTHSYNYYATPQLILTDIKILHTSQPVPQNQKDL